MIIQMKKDIFMDNGKQLEKLWKQLGKKILSIFLVKFLILMP